MVDYIFSWSPFTYMTDNVTLLADALALRCRQPVVLLITSVKSCFANGTYRISRTSFVLHSS